MSEADRDAFRLVPETCPFVDRAISESEREILFILDSRFDLLIDGIREDDIDLRAYEQQLAGIEREIRHKVIDSMNEATEGVKKQTCKLRDALIDKCQEVIDERQLVYNLESEIERLKDEISDLKSDLRNAQKG